MRFIFNLLACLTLCVLFLNTSTASQTGSKQASLSIGELEASPGEIIQVPVIANGMQNVSDFELHILYDVGVLGAVPGENVLVNIHPSISAVYSIITAQDVIFVSWFNFSPTSIPDGSVMFELNLRFCDDLLSCALSETESDIHFNTQKSFVNTGSLIEGTWGPLNVQYNNGSVVSDIPYRVLDITQVGKGAVKVDGEAYDGPMVEEMGTSFSLEAIAHESTYFDAWYENDQVLSSQSNIELNLDGNRFIDVLFITKTYTITATAGPGGSITPAGDIIVEHGEEMSFQVEPDIGYHIAEVLVNDLPQGAITSYTFQDVTSNQSISAEFSLNIYELTYDEGAHGSIPENAQQEVEHGSDGLPVEVIPDEGYHFTAWSDGDTSNPRIDAGITGPVDVTALYQINTYEINAAVVPAGAGLIEGVGQYEHGQTVSLEATASPGFEFNAWKEGNNTLSTDPTLSFTAVENRELTAHFMAEGGDEQLTLDQETVSAGESVCFSASVSIATAGNNGWFSVEAQGEAILVAGESIRMMPGTSVESGGYLLAYISPESPFCEPAQTAQETNEQEGTEAADEMMPSWEMSVRLFPNPNRGLFTIETGHAEHPNTEIHIEVFDIYGTRLVNESRLAAGALPIDISDQPHGIYLVRISQGGHSTVKRIIKH